MADREFLVVHRWEVPGGEVAYDPGARQTRVRVGDQLFMIPELQLTAWAAALWRAWFVSTNSPSCLVTWPAARSLSEADLVELKQRLQAAMYRPPQLIVLPDSPVRTASPSDELVNAGAVAELTLNAVTVQREAVPGAPQEGPYPATLEEIADELGRVVGELDAHPALGGVRRLLIERLVHDQRTDRDDTERPTEDG